MLDKRVHSVAACLTLVVGTSCGGSDRAMQSDSVPTPSRIIDLSPTITEDLPLRAWGSRALRNGGFRERTAFEIIEKDHGSFYVSNSYWTLMNHGGAHVDAPNHLERGAPGIDSYSLDALVGPLRLLDFRSRGSDEAIGVDELETREIGPGAVVILLTGYAVPADPDELPAYAYLSREAAEYLAGLPVRAIGTDALSVDSFRRVAERKQQGLTGYAAIAPVHHAFLPRRIPVIEQLENVDALVGVERAVFVGLPLKVKDGDGSPVRAAAFVY